MQTLSKISESQIRSVSVYLAYFCTFISLSLSKSKSKVMSAKVGADYIEFDRALNVSKELIKSDKTKNIGLYIAVSIYTGLRASDVLELKWEQLREDSLDITEKKTKKKTHIKLNDELKKIISKVDAGKSGYAFISQKGSRFAIQSINRRLQTIFTKELKSKKKISSHSLRKTFGRRVWDKDNQSERALIHLSQCFNHTSTAVTRRYLGITQNEIDDIYLNL